MFRCSLRIHFLANIHITNYEKHALRVSQVIAAVAKFSRERGLRLVARVKKVLTNAVD